MPKYTKEKEIEFLEFRIKQLEKELEYARKRLEELKKA
jgi:chaperonin cofactor prefoldin